MTTVTSYLNYIRKENPTIQEQSKIKALEQLEILDDESVFL